MREHSYAIRYWYIVCVCCVWMAYFIAADDYAEHLESASGFVFVCLCTLVVSSARTLYSVGYMPGIVLCLKLPVQDEFYTRFVFYTRKH